MGFYFSDLAAIRKAKDGDAVRVDQADGVYTELTDDEWCRMFLATPPRPGVPGIAQYVIKKRAT